MKPAIGSQSVRTVTERNIFWQTGGERYLDGPIVIDATYAYDGSNTGYETELRVGTLLGQCTTSKLWVPLKRTAVNDSGATANNFVVDNAALFKAGDTITVGTDDVTIDSINYSTNTITLTSSITFADNDAVVGRGSLAGAETARAVLGETVDLLDPVTHTARDVYAAALFKGYLLQSAMIGDLTNALAATNYLSEIVWKENQRP